MKTIDEMSDEEFLSHIKQRNRDFLEEGVKFGWWEGIDEKDNPIPFPKIVKVSELPPKAVMAYVVHKAGLFDSVSEARKNGWNKPIVQGILTIKNKMRILIVS